jgi:hypothetical protein
MMMDYEHSVFVLRSKFYEMIDNNELVRKEESGSKVLIHIPTKSAYIFEKELELLDVAEPVIVLKFIGLE